MYGTRMTLRTNIGQIFMSFPGAGPAPWTPRWLRHRDGRQTSTQPHDCITSAV